jgi:hypothetical protein
MGSFETNPMSVSHEIKSQLAKLLATEDIVVEHKKVPTACFNVHTRVLTLPMWEKASNTVYDLLVGHEVGHALFTPDEDWTETVKVPQQFVNIVEDARIEKLMKRKYAGLAKTFYNGYRELSDEDFFQIGEDDVNKFNLADRTNLYFKIGNYIIINFTQEEKEIIRLIDACETFADVLIAAEELYKYCKNKPENLEKIDDSQDQGTIISGSGSQTPESTPFEQSDSDSDDGDSQNEENSESYGGTSQGSDIYEDNKTAGDDNNDEEPEVRTADALEDKIRELVNNLDQENVYVEIPKVNLETIIAKNSDVHGEIDSFFNRQQELYKNNPCRSSDNVFDKPDSEFKKFKASTQKEVNYLVKEFECRKAADQYARASTARTGILDTARLYTYKYNDDLFKKVSVIPDGKNHGLVFVLDWSGSMCDVMTDTCKQLFNLIWFCRKVSIPFEVYAFTNEWAKISYDYDKGEYIPFNIKPHYEKRDGLLHIHESFSLMNILTSKVSASVLEHQMMNVWRLAYSFGRYYSVQYTYPSRLSLSGTPLNEALVCLHEILPKFQKENKLQKVQCIVLTDGEAGQLLRHREIISKDETYLGTGYVHPITTFLRDRKLGTTYKFGCNYTDFTNIIVKNLKDNFPHMNFIGIRVLESRNFSNFVSNFSNFRSKERSKINDDWKKLRSFVITTSGYDAYFGISSSALSQESAFDVDENATKTQIKSAFVKSLKTKKLNKKVLSEFVELIA